MNWKEKYERFKKWAKEEYTHYKVTPEGELKHSIETVGPKLILKEEVVDFINKIEDLDLSQLEEWLIMKLYEKENK